MGWLLPTMDLPKVNLQRDVVKNERRESYDNQPYGRAGETILAALYPPDHPYSWPVIGSMTDLSAATLEDVRGFFRTYYAPNNATLVVAGDFRPDSAKQWITRYFGDIPRGPAIPPRPRVPAVTVPRDTFLVLEDHVQLPRVFYAWHSVKAFHPDDAALNLLAYILAGDKASRLYRDLVYDRQVAQDVDADQEGNRLDGQFGIDVPNPASRPNGSIRWYGPRSAASPTAGSPNWNCSARRTCITRKCSTGWRACRSRRTSSTTTTGSRATRITSSRMPRGTPASRPPICSASQERTSAHTR
jgi:hypothetical protein